MRKKDLIAKLEMENKKLIEERDFFIEKAQTEARLLESLKTNWTSKNILSMCDYDDENPHMKENMEYNTFLYYLKGDINFRLYFLSDDEMIPVCARYPKTSKFASECNGYDTYLLRRKRSLENKETK